MSEDDELDAYYNKWLNERAKVKRLTDQNARLCNSLVGIRRASDVRRRERDGERHQYYYHTADAALERNDAPEQTAPEPATSGENISAADERGLMPQPPDFKGIP